ncbi:Major facilitator superfamily,Major facilitator superfamily domain [Cinara cedri]|uniref:Major facilitator superfamily,Major facilitator superfamily domain n=1 Tax=Cinara cedri TaxID=506608 RepID=A0A5E4MIQ8_9HEMI|nr:Major facilitator superfamily,Major facilitator superfamily domain [Cinara cedri]
MTETGAVLDEPRKNDADDEQPIAAGGVWSRICRVLLGIHVEPFVCFYIMSRTLMLLPTQNLSLQKACRVNLNLSDDTCTALDNPNGRVSINSSWHKDDEVATQRMVADMFVWQLIIQSSVPCILAIFIGSWSDRNRKRVPCMVLPIASELIRVIGLLVCVYFFYELPMEAVGLMEAIPTSLAGGRMVLFNALFSYVADVTNEEMKTLRIGIVNLLSTIGMAIGTALSGITFRKLGFYGVYTTSASLYVLGILYGLICIKEVSPAKNKPVEKNRDGIFNGFFNAKHIKEAFEVTFKDGPYNRKLRIIMLLCVAFLVMGPLNGELSVSYMNTRVRFNWNEVDFSMFSTYSTVTNIAGTALSIGLFSHVLKIDDSLIGVMACAGKIVAGVFYAFATVGWVYYMGPLVDIMGGTIFITARSIMAKIVQPDELGQVTAIYGIVESLVPIIFGPLYTIIYKNTVKTLPGLYSLVGSILAIPAIVIYLWMYKESQKSKKGDYTKANIAENGTNEEMQSL